MKKTILIVAVFFAIVVILALGIFFMKSKQSDEPGNGGTDSDKIKTVSQITLGSKQYINSLKKINISETDDYIMVTEDVKWEVPEHDKGETVSFSIAIPYIIVVDDVEYTGIYELGDYSKITGDKNSKYNFSVTNLTKNGEIEVLITTK